VRAVYVIDEKLKLDGDRETVYLRPSVPSTGAAGGLPLPAAVPALASKPTLRSSIHEEASAFVIWINRKMATKIPAKSLSKASLPSLCA
jgi:hypothetical protein